MGHHSCCNKQKVRRGPWSPEEDEKLINYISTCGHGCWSSVPRQAGLERSDKSCRLRWTNCLRPDLKHGNFSSQEANLIIEHHKVLGNRWSQIAKLIPGRTENEVKNFWNSNIKKKLMSNAISDLTKHPDTSKPVTCNEGFCDEDDDDWFLSVDPAIPTEVEVAMDIAQVEMEHLNRMRAPSGTGFLENGDCWNPIFENDDDWPRI